MDKFYVGQRVVITDNTCGHLHEIGEIVTLTKATQVNEEYWDLESEEWFFDSDDCRPLNEEEE